MNNNLFKRKSYKINNLFELKDLFKLRKLELILSFWLKLEGYWHFK